MMSVETYEREMRDMCEKTKEMRNQPVEGISASELEELAGANGFRYNITLDELGEGAIHFYYEGDGGEETARFGLTMSLRIDVNGKKPTPEKLAFSIDRSEALTNPKMVQYRLNKAFGRPNKLYGPDHFFLDQYGKFLKDAFNLRASILARKVVKYEL